MSLARIVVPIVLSLSTLSARADDPRLRQVQVKVGEPAAIQLQGVALTGSCDDPSVARVSFGTNTMSVRANGLRSGITRCTFSDDTNHQMAIELVVSEPDLDAP
jgi:hypothetical protein